MPKDLSYTIKILLEQVAEGDEKAFRTIFEHYKNPFFEAAFKLTRSVDISEEIVQEVFVTLWLKRQLIASANHPGNYLFTILHNCIYAHFRKIAREHQLKSEFGQEQQESEDLIEALLVEKEDKAILENVISHMPPQQRLVYKLAKQEQWSRKEIAQRLNISPNTVKNHLSAAVEILRTYFKNGAFIIICTIIWIYS